MKAKIFSKLTKLPWRTICLIGLVVIFFSIRLTITYDSAHYLNYVSIFENKLPASSWDIVRGPIFPATIFMFDVIFGKTGTGILIGTFLFYLIFAISCYYICKELCQHYKHKNIIQRVILIILILNPLIMGYFHVLLTEFIAITITILNILLAYKWIYCDTHNKKKLFFYSAYFIFSTMFCYHLKQSYIIIALAPLIIAAIISIVHRHTKMNIIYRAGTFIFSIIFFLISIFAWNSILKSINANTDTGRDSSSMFSQQLLKAYQITYDQDNDGKNDSVSVINAIGIIFQDFISNPSRIIGIYASNYCGLISICNINTNDGVEYTPTFEFAGINTFENSAIGYRPYSDYSNIFSMNDELYNNAILYGESGDRSLIAIIMNIFRIPTNLLFKISMLLCFPFLVFLVVIRIRHRNTKYSKLFILNLILLSTSFLHLALSAGIGLIIDRYAIEIFIPSTLGIIGTTTYYYLIRQKI